VTSYRQIEANRRNALKSTGPRTEAGKEVSRRNAMRHGLTAETVIGALEEDYRAFEAAITADYDAQSAIERELVLRLASVLWRLRRATTMETGLFDIQAEHLRERQQGQQLLADSGGVIHTVLQATTADGPAIEFAQCFLRLANLPNFALDGLAAMNQIFGARPGECSMRSRCLIVASRRSERSVFEGLRRRSEIEFELAARCFVRLNSL
jgi:hypothetical protein